MFEKKNQIKIEKNEMKAKKFDSKKYIGILCKHGMNGGDSSQEICLKALIIDYWKLLGCVRTMCVVHWVTFSFEIISVRLMMLCVAKDFHINVFFSFALTVYFDSVQWYRSHLRFIFIAEYDWKMRCIQNQVVSKRGAIIVTCNIAPTIIYSQPSIEVSITCHLLLLLAHEPSCKCCI